MSDDQLNRLASSRTSKTDSTRSDRPATRAGARPSQAPIGGYRAGPDLSRCPNGYDPDVWSLALEFIAQAEEYEVDLEASVPVTYALLFRRLGKTKLRERQNWMEIVSKMIAEFWLNDVEIYTESRAINQFTGVETFTGLAKWAIRMLAPEPEVVAVHDGTRPQSEGAAKRKARALRRKQARDRLNAVDMQDPESINAFIAEARARRQAIMKELSE